MSLDLTTQLAVCVSMEGESGYMISTMGCPPDGARWYQGTPGAWKQACPTLDGEPQELDSEWMALVDDAWERWEAEACTTKREVPSDH